MDVYSLITEQDCVMFPLIKVVSVTLKNTDILVEHDNGHITKICNNSREDAKKVFDILHKGMLDVKSN